MPKVEFNPNPVNNGKMYEEFKKSKNLRCKCGAKLAEYNDNEVRIMDRKCKTVAVLRVVNGELKAEKEIKSIIENIPPDIKEFCETHLMSIDIMIKLWENRKLYEQFD